MKTPRMEVNPGDIIKVRVELPPKTALSRTEVRTQIRAWAERVGVQLYAIEIIAPKAAPTRAARDRHRASDTDLVQAYAKKMKQGKVTVAAGLKLMEEV